MEDGAVRAHVAHVEELLGAIEDDAPALAAVQGVVGLYGEALRRLVERADPATDELVSHLLVLHGLHPDAVETRVRRALDEVRPYLRSHGGDVQLVAVEEPVVRLRLEGTCNGCQSSTATMKLAIEEAVQRQAPEIARVEADGAAPQPLLQIGRTAARPSEGGWRAAGAIADLDGAPALRRVDGTPVLFLRVGDDLYAYRDTCPACGSSLEHGTLAGAELRCNGCGRSFDARRAGRCLDAPSLSLEPLPLLVGDAGEVRVAVA
jgi:Fe-S cluster biogenesis protein NfuA/nitrite reductase/ring-hydroxylating ferredoxin subunit